MSPLRALLALVVVTAAVVAQLTVFPHLAWGGIGPNLALLAVVAAGVARGPAYGAVLGLVAGLLVDLAPPADHTAGRWALALVVVGLLAGAIAERRPVRFGVGPVMVLAAGCSFVGSSVFALTGLLLADPRLATSELVSAILVGLVWDVLLAPLVVLPVLLLLTRTRAARVAV